MYVQTLPTLGFMEAVKISYKKFCTFSGRARRSEFWWLNLFLGILMTILSFIIFILFIIIFAFNFGTRYNRYLNKWNKKYQNNTFYLGIEIPLLFIFVIIIEIILAIPLISASVRRLHDTGKSGLFLLLTLVPFGNLILLIFFIEDSQQNANEYGPSPKYLLIQGGPVINNSSQAVQVSGMPALNSQYLVYSQANPYQQYQQYQQFPQNSQAPIINNLYQEPIQDLPSNQEQIATPMVSP